MRWEQLPCLDDKLERAEVPAPSTTQVCSGRSLISRWLRGGDFGPWAWDNSRCYTKRVLRNVAQTQIITWPLLRSEGGSGRRAPRLIDVARRESQRRARILSRPQ